MNSELQDKAATCLMCCFCSFKTTVVDWDGIENKVMRVEYQGEEKLLAVYLEEEFGSSAETF